jgi:hypothetical protein
VRHQSTHEETHVNEPTKLTTIGTPAKDANTDSLIRIAGIGRLFTYTEARAALRCSRTELFRRLKDGRLKAVGQGKCKRIAEVELVRHLTESEAA